MSQRLSCEGRIGSYSVRSGAVDRLEQCAKQLGRLLEHIRGLVLETVHQRAVAVIVVVEDPPQILPGRQAPVPLQLGRNRRPVDGCDPMILHSGNGILSDCNLKQVARIERSEIRDAACAVGCGEQNPDVALLHPGYALVREDVEYLILDEPEISSPIIMSCRTNDRSPLLAHILKLIDGFDQWTDRRIRAQA